MLKEKEIKFEKSTFGKRLGTMLKVDFKRMLTMPLIYILVALCLIMPVVILVMTTMMDGTVTVNPETKVETVVEGFDNVWQIIGTVGGGESTGQMDMGISSMVNINMLYMLISVLVCIFISDDFRSGYAKNLFTVRPDKSDYVISKTVVCMFGGVLMIVAFVIGSLLGGAISALPFEMVGFNLFNLIMCILSKIALVSVFVPIFIVMSVAAKQRLWLSLILSLASGMLLFMMIPMLTPLNATAISPILCLCGGALFSVGIGFISKLVLEKTSLV